MINDKSEDREEGALSRLLELVGAEPDLQRRLGSIVNPDEFFQESRKVATAAGIEIAPGVIEAALAAAGQRPVAQSNGGWPPLCWLPTRAVGQATELAFEWHWFGVEPLNKPFFADTVSGVTKRPYARLSRQRTNEDDLLAGATGEPQRGPDGLIFHLSRCGSTLAAQMLAAIPHHLVVSEAEPIDDAVRWANCPNVARDRAFAGLRSTVAALGRNRSGTDTRFFVKLDAWHALSLPLFREAFPDVPWMFLYRDPVEVLVSHARLPGSHMVPGASPGYTGNGGKANLASPMDFQAQVLAQIEMAQSGKLESGIEYQTTALASIMRAALSALGSGKGMVVNYRDLPAAMFDEVPRHFGFFPDPGELKAMAQSAARDAKDPMRTFSPDSDDKRAEASEEIVRAASGTLAGPYQALETARLSQKSSEYAGRH